LEVPVTGYYNQDDLPRFAEMGQDAPELWKKFSEWYGAVFAEGALSEREKCLIALAVAHAVQCPYCIDAFTQGCFEKGSNLEQMTEAVHIASAIRGGASLVHGLQMRSTAARVSM
jgi:alkylhydroperoxidase/carboxymuconolactone decarboxylase family protein